MELYPIRIDVSYPPKSSSATAKAAGVTSDTVGTSAVTTTTTTTTSDANSTMIIRIIDTLMIDPNVSLLRFDRNDVVGKRNAIFTQWAHSMISDAFVVGMTKMNAPTTTAAATTTTTTTSSSSKRKPEFTGRYSLTDTSATSANITTSSSTSIHDTIVYYDSLMQQAIQQIRKQFLIIEQYEQLLQNNKNNAVKSSLIPIRIRMELPSTGSDHNNNQHHRPPIRYHDDFLWDLSNQFVSPIQMAQSIVNDLQLSHDSVPIITIHILEQIIQNCTTQNANKHDNDLDMHSNMDDDEGIRMGPAILLQQQQMQQDAAPPMQITAAWEISPAIHNTNRIHLETFHKK